MRRDMGLDYLMRKYIFYPLEQIFWRLPAIAIYFQIPWLFPDFPSPYYFPWPSTKFPDFSLSWKKFHFPDIFPWPWQPWLKTGKNIAERVYMSKYLHWIWYNDIFMHVKAIVWSQNWNPMTICPGSLMTYEFWTWKKTLVFHGREANKMGNQCFSQTLKSQEMLAIATWLMRMRAKTSKMMTKSW